MEVVVWFLAGILFLLIEITHFGFVSFFFGLGAILVAITTWLGLTESLPTQLLAFIVTSLILLALLRKTLSATFKGRISGKLKSGEDVGDVRGEKAVVTTDIYPDRLDGSVEFHGTRWSAQADETIAAGTVVEIVDRVDLTLKVRKAG